MWYLIHIFDRNGGDVIVSTAVVSVRESEDDAVEYGEMDWERKESCTSYISMGRSLPGTGPESVPGVGRVAGECPEHPCKVLMGSSAVSAC